VRLKRVCWDAGEFGWARFEQWEWRESVRRSVESFYREDPVLPPGGYRLDVITAWQNEAGTGDPTWQTTPAPFTVGPPPGLGSGAGERYPAGGPLNDLGTYVAETVPKAGGRPFYRAYDVGVAFNENYVTTMFLAAGQPLTVAVVDSNGVDRRKEAPNHWGRGPDLNLSRSETEWVRTLHGDGTSRCAEIDLAPVVRDEGVLAGAGELLGPDELHAGELRAGSKPVYRFEFVSSRFAGFAHQVSTFDGRCHLLSTKTVQDPAGVAAPVLAARSALDGAASAAVIARNAVEGGTPTSAQLDALEAALAALRLRRETLRVEEQTAFEALWASYSLPKPQALPAGVECARTGDALLVESPEPLHWERVTAGLRRTTSVPRRKRTLTFAPGLAPDVGDFSVGGLEWTTDAELRVVDGALERRVAGALALSVTTPRAFVVEAVVRVAANGSATLQPTGPGASAAATSGPSGGTTTSLEVSGTELSSVTLSGAGLSLVSLSVTEAFEPRPPRGDVRLTAASLPTSTGDSNHYVDLIAHRAVDLGGWGLRWFDALAPAGSSSYHTFQAGRSLPEARRARVYGGLTGGKSAAGMDVHFGGTVGAVPATGAIFQLVDPAGEVAHELASLPYGPPSLQDRSRFVAVPNDDTTRAFLLSTTDPLEPGHWQLELAFESTPPSPDLARLSIGNQSLKEQAIVGFTIR
jgi:hypothetical protein